MLSLRDTITGLKQAGNVEGRLKTDLVNAFEQLAASRAAQVKPACNRTKCAYLSCMALKKQKCGLLVWLCKVFGLTIPHEQLSSP